MDHNTWEYLCNDGEHSSCEGIVNIILQKKSKITGDSNAKLVDISLILCYASQQPIAIVNPDKI